MRSFLRAAAALLLLFAYFLVSFVLFFVPAGPVTRRRLFIRNASFFARRALAALGIRVTVHHRDRLSPAGRGRLIAANHLSSLDILILSSLAPSVFITSVEMRNTLFLGILARFGGSLFVERRKPSGLRKEISAIAGVLRRGFSVILFPEGTTSNGDCVMTFRNALFDAAIRAEADVQPVCIRYRRVDGQPLSKANRDAVLYYGGVPFRTHLRRLLASSSVDVEVTILKALSSRAYPTRKQLAEQSYREVTGVYCRHPHPAPR